MNQQPVVLLLTTREGSPIAVRFANRAAAEKFEARHRIEDASGIVPILTQSDALFEGAFRA